MPDKHHLFVFLFLSICLSACAERTIPPVSPPPPLAEKIELIADVKAQHSMVDVAEKMTSIQEMLACIERMESQQAASVAKEILHLEAGLELNQDLERQALDQQVHSENLLKKFCLACLLSRDAANNAEWARAHTLLAALIQDLEHEEERQLARQMMRTLKLKKQLHQHQTQLNSLRLQNNELVDKIEQLKGLERDLDVTRPLSSESAL